MAQNILIIEDDSFLRDLLKKKLESFGFSVSEAIDGDKGIKKTKEEKPDLILLDLLLPTTDGFEVLSRIKQDASTSSIPVVILSNLGQKEDIDRGIKLGAMDYLVKAQSTPDDIAAKVIMVLKKGK